MSETGSYLCIDNICISYEKKDFEKTEAALNGKIFSVFHIIISKF